MPSLFPSQTFKNECNNHKLEKGAVSRKGTTYIEEKCLNKSCDYKKVTRGIL